MRDRAGSCGYDRAVEPLGLLRRSQPLGPGGTPGASSDADAEASDERPLRCARCGAVVTTGRARISVGGAHEHSRANPGGWVHRFGCFAHAPGCRSVGEPSAEFAWFAGTTWQIAVCGACREHLGWRFQGPDGTFWGLRVAKVVEED